MIRNFAGWVVDRMRDENCHSCEPRHFRMFYIQMFSVTGMDSKWHKWCSMELFFNFFGVHSL